MDRIKLISADFDQNYNKLKLSLEGKFENDFETVEAISKLTEAIDRVDHEIKLLKSSLQCSESISQLKSRVQMVLERESQNEAQPGEILSTPLKNASLNENNFEAEEDFPSTPTLEQLGLSGRTLSIVGRKSGFDSSASLSDNEFDNSFYQKSPVMNCVDNSFSSDVSAPNFRIFNSSPVTASTASVNNNSVVVRGKSHNLKQVTTAASVLVDFAAEESSIEEPLTKKVHFCDEAENKITNK